MDKSQIAVNVFNTRAELYQEKFMDVSQYHNTLDMFCEQLNKEDAHILEIACGPGNITQYLLQRMPKLQLLCTDLAPNMLELAKKNNPQVATLLLDAKSINSLTERYDGVMCGFVMPYMSKEETQQLVQDTAALLIPGGVAYFSTMERDYDTSGWETNSKGDRVYVYYHEAGYLVQALEDAGFDNIIVHSQDFVHPDGKGTRDLILIAVKA